MSTEPARPETRVLAIASHVGCQRPFMPAVRMADTSYQGCLWVSLPIAPIDHLARPIQSMTGYRYVGNKMAAFVMQTMGCDVAAINTVHFSMPLQATDPRSAPSGL